MNRIAILITWHGKMPDYFSYFLKGCKHNQEVLDIHLFTDSKIEYTIPHNVYIHDLS